MSEEIRKVSIKQLSILPKFCKRFKTRRMAITANKCYNNHTPISLGVSHVSVPVGFPYVHNIICQTLHPNQVILIFLKY